MFVESYLRESHMTLVFVVVALAGAGMFGLLVLMGFEYYRFVKRRNELS
jgi:hypothetical protein